MACCGAGVVCLVLILCCAVQSLAKDYTVGESSGWAIGMDYSTWTSGKTFTVGDTLVFNYISGHSVDQVSASDYSTCTVGNAIKTDSSGATNFPLKTAGTYYFICGVPGHCGSGMKVAVTVAAAAGGATPTTPSGTPPSTTTTTTSPATPTTTPTTTPRTYTDSSSSGTLSPFVAMMISLVAFFKFVSQFFDSCLV
ncbi:Blue copper protein [Actinidia chinensis var. chinensis]|uniref:Blue copper protein n=1 Tax=Actinidia chinensis var. chinensis TaxID=1590841 RepID=A0A2R6RNK9_ACTCC|nr:Blue copper protein [Actinidia chinensis var. chinensis]